MNYHLLHRTSYVTPPLAHDKVIAVIRAFLREAQSEGLISGFDYCFKTISHTDDFRYYEVPAIETGVNVPFFVTCPTELFCRRIDTGGQTFLVPSIRTHGTAFPAQQWEAKGMPGFHPLSLTIRQSSRKSQK